ncbi:MAG: HAMP domain-containing sensor histidine kinase [Isosphaeraceae bacterium]
MTPPTVILTHLDLALARPRSPEEYRQTLATCKRAAGRMRSLVDDLLALARVDAGRLELKYQDVDIRQVVRQCVAQLEPLATGRDVRLVVAGDPAPLRGDPDRLAQVVTNLLHNAIQYNKPGGRVSLTTRIDRGEAVLDVADTGIGIAEDDLAHLFDRFYRVDAARSRESGGSGLGLAIGKGLVEAHGGRVAVASTPGRGTTFTVRLPQSEARPFVVDDQP